MGIWGHSPHRGCWKMLLDPKMMALGLVAHAHYFKDYFGEMPCILIIFLLCVHWRLRQAYVEIPWILVLFVVKYMQQKKLKVLAFLINIYCLFQGKSLSLICSALAWLHQYNSDRKVRILMEYTIYNI